MQGGYMAGEGYFYTMRDSYGRPTTLSVEALGAADATSCQTVAGYLQAYTALRVEPIGQIKRGAAVASPPAPTTDSIASKSVLFRFNVIGSDGNPYEVFQVLPDLKDVYMSGSQVNIGHADVIAFWANFTGATSLMTLKDGGYIVSNAGAPTILDGYRL